MKIINVADCNHCPEGVAPLTAEELRHNEQVSKWWMIANELGKSGMIYDSVNDLYITNDSVLKMIRSEYYSAFLVPIKKLPFKHNQNLSSPQSASETMTIRFRLVCKDCNYPKRKQLYYIFEYDKAGNVINHRLALLKQIRKKKSVRTNLR